MQRPFVSRRWLALPLVLLCACGSGKRRADILPPNVSGTITNEAGTPVAGVKVTLEGLDASSVSAANGTYTLVATQAHVGRGATITLTHPDYTPLHGTVGLITTNNTADYQLRAHGIVTTVALPAAAGDPPATVTAPGDANGGGATLRIHAGDLALPSGAAATGNAQVKMTYWGTGSSFMTAPAPLYGLSPGDANAAGLYSYGMANVEVTQGNDVLQVAAGKTLALDFARAPGVDPNLLQNLDPNDPTGPHLWYADPNTGRWTAAGGLATGATTVDPNDGTVHAALPHLSAWNIDGIAVTNSCLTGKVINNCNTNTVGAKYSLWMLTTTGELAVFTIQPDATGTYYVNINGAAVNAMGQQQKTGEFYAWVSGYQQPDQTVCNPTGKSTYSALCTKDAPGQYYVEHSCAGWDTGLRSDPGANRPIDYKSWVARCPNLQPLSMPMCGYAPGTRATTDSGRCQYWEGGNLHGGLQMTEGMCGTMPDFVVPGCGSPPQTGDKCKEAGAKQEGDACNQDIDCCPNASLECADGLCVPRTDAG